MLSFAGSVSQMLFLCPVCISRSYVMHTLSMQNVLMMLLRVSAEFVCSCTNPTVEVTLIP